jgi:hypothetical protein
LPNPRSVTSRTSTSPTAIKLSQTPQSSTHIKHALSERENTILSRTTISAAAPTRRNPKAHRRLPRPPWEPAPPHLGLGGRVSHFLGARQSRPVRWR